MSTRATMTTKLVQRPANLYASMPAVIEKAPSQEEIDRDLRAAQRSINRKIELEAQRLAEDRRLLLIAKVAAVTSVLTALTLFFLM